MGSRLASLGRTRRSVQVQCPRCHNRIKLDVKMARFFILLFICRRHSTHRRDFNDLNHCGEVCHQCRIDNNHARTSYNRSLFWLHTFIVSMSVTTNKEPVNMRSIIEYFGLIAIGVSCLVVLVAVVLLILLIGCVALGAVDSVLNPHAAQDTRIEYQNATSQINNGVAGISGAVANVTGR